MFSAKLQVIDLDAILSPQSGVSYEDLQRGYAETGSDSIPGSRTIMEFNPAITQALQEWSAKHLGCHGYITLFWSDEIHSLVRENESEDDQPEPETVDALRIWTKISREYNQVLVIQFV